MSRARFKTPDFLRQFIPIHFRHHDVRQDQIRPRFLSNRQSRFPALCDQQLTPDAFQGLKKHLKVGRLIVNQKDGFGNRLVFSHDPFLSLDSQS
jgi:hypothetical protein